jgi:hypothetical protein
MPDEVLVGARTLHSEDPALDTVDQIREEGTDRHEAVVHLVAALRMPVVVMRNAGLGTTFPRGLRRASTEEPRPCPDGPAGNGYVRK